MHRSLLLLMLVSAPAALPPASAAQQYNSAPPESTITNQTDVPDAPSPAQQDPAPPTVLAPKDHDYEGKQTKRILGIIPNFRSVSIDEKLPPLSPHQKLKLMFEDTFDYSNFVYVGIDRK